MNKEQATRWADGKLSLWQIIGIVALAASASVVIYGFIIIVAEMAKALG